MSARALARAIHRHLSIPERHSRKVLRIPLGHPERVAYHVPHPERWEALAADLWPLAEYTEVIEDVAREERWGQPG